MAYGTNFRLIEEITEDELADLWIMIGGAPHLFNEEVLREWLSTGDQIEDLEFGANEIVQVGIWLYSKGFRGDSRSEWDLTQTDEIINNLKQS